MWGKIKQIRNNLTLSQRFMLAALVILLAGMLGIGAWVEQQIVTGVIHRAGATTALYVDSFVAPNLQELGAQQPGASTMLLPEHTRALGSLLQDTPMGQQIVALKIWDTRGRVIYSSDPATVGKSFPMGEGLLRARLGEVVSEISTLDDEENRNLGTQHDRLLETYSPVWLSGTDQIIAVAEFYTQTDALEQELAVLKGRSWLVVGLAILVIYLLLAGFVRNSSNTILQQQGELSRQVTLLTGLLAQNRELHERVRRAAASVALLNEGYLKRTGSELHDGPAQELGLSLLKLDALSEQVEGSVLSDRPQADRQQTLSKKDVVREMGEIQALLQNALKEMRGIAAGLSLPQLTELGLAETVIRVARAHERRTGTRVDLTLDALPEQVALPLKITVYRLIQEGLNNAYRHAAGAGQRVHVCLDNSQLVVEILDSGPGFQPPSAGESSGRLGLSGMRERVESLEGTFKIESRAGQGTHITARLPYEAAAA